MLGGQLVNDEHCSLLETYYVLDPVIIQKGMMSIEFLAQY